MINEDCRELSTSTGEYTQMLLGSNPIIKVDKQRCTFTSDNGDFLNVPTNLIKSAITDLMHNPPSLTQTANTLFISSDSINPENYIYKDSLPSQNVEIIVEAIQLIEISKLIHEVSPFDIRSLQNFLSKLYNLAGNSIDEITGQNNIDTNKNGPTDTVKTEIERSKIESSLVEAKNGALEAFYNILGVADYAKLREQNFPYLDDGSPDPNEINRIQKEIQKLADYPPNFELITTIDQSLRSLLTCVPEEYKIGFKNSMDRLNNTIVTYDISLLPCINRWWFMSHSIVKDHSESFGQNFDEMEEGFDKHQREHISAAKAIAHRLLNLLIKKADFDKLKLSKFGDDYDLITELIDTMDNWPPKTKTLLAIDERFRLLMKMQAKEDQLAYERLQEMHPSSSDSLRPQHLRLRWEKMVQALLSNSTYPIRQDVIRPIYRDKFSNKDIFWLSYGATISFEGDRCVFVDTDITDNDEDPRDIRSRSSNPDNTLSVPIDDLRTAIQEILENPDKHFSYPGQIYLRIHSSDSNSMIRRNGDDVNKVMLMIEPADLFAVAWKLNSIEPFEQNLTSVFNLNNLPSNNIPRANYLDHKIIPVQRLVSILAKFRKILTPKPIGNTVQRQVTVDLSQLNLEQEEKQKLDKALTIARELIVLLMENASSQKLNTSRLNNDDDKSLITELIEKIDSWPPNTAILKALDERFRLLMEMVPESKREMFDNLMKYYKNSQLESSMQVGDVVTRWELMLTSLLITDIK